MSKPRRQPGPPPPDGLVIVDKPAGLTSHDVVGRMRRIAGTRRVGHAGTLDPMATGVLVIGVERATRLLGHLALTEKAYDAVIRLGQTTLTDDAEGETTATAPTEHLTRAQVDAAVARLTGPIMQVPSKVSAIKVAGRRSYARVRAGEDVDLPARPVTVSTFEVHEMSAAATTDGSVVDLRVSVACSSGTYVRALARDLGTDLGTGGHLTALRRTRVGPYTVTRACTLEQLTDTFTFLPIADAAGVAFTRRDVTAREAKVLAHGGSLDAVGVGPGPIAVFGPGGELVALVEEALGRTRPVAVFADPAAYRTADPQGDSSRG